MAGRGDTPNQYLDTERPFSLASRPRRSAGDPQQHCDFDHDSCVDRVRDPANDAHACIHAILIAHPDQLRQGPHDAVDARCVPGNVLLLHGGATCRTCIAAPVCTCRDRNWGDGASAAVGLLIYFIHHISQSISVNHIVDRIARETELVIEELMPHPRDGCQNRFLPWLPGYENSSPVRIGNDASQQLQLDVFGEVADVTFQTLKAGMAQSERGRALRPVVLEYLSTAWRQPDEGLWEVRGGAQHFVHSKVMAWVAFDRAANEVATGEFDESEQRWREIADEIHAEVCERGFDRDLTSFVQAYSSKRLDASLLLIPLVGFLPASDPRVQGTLRAVEDKLLIDAEFVLRYETGNPGDGLPEGEGAFLACSFCLVDNYILQGRHAEARKLFDRLLSCCNDVGLHAEEYDPLTGRMLGNFPQA
jgi:GH15 family glucan-1,4-alpha-glucosidase